MRSGDKLKNEKKSQHFGILILNGTIPAQIAVILSQ
jgi:hypothetical protein